MPHPVTWSKNGFVAYALRNGVHNLALTYMENTNGRRWQLAQPQRLCVKPLDDLAVPHVTLVQWSNLLTDLAVFDENGHFYILLAGVRLLGDGRESERGKNDKNGAKKDGDGANGTNDAADAAGETRAPSYELTSYNHMEMIFRDRTPGRCVAFLWLGLEKAAMAPKPAARDATGGYGYGVAQKGAPLPAHPIPSKQACVALRQNGLLTLYYQGEHKVEYHQALVVLGAGARYSHAAIGAGDGRIVVAAHDPVARAVAVYVLTVDWGHLVSLAVRQRTDPHYQTPAGAREEPRLSCVLVHEMKVPAATAAKAGAEEAAAIAEMTQMAATAETDDMTAEPPAPAPEFAPAPDRASSGPSPGDSVLSAPSVALVDIVGLAPMDVLVTYHTVASAGPGSSEVRRYRLRDIDPLRAAGPDAAVQGVFSEPKVPLAEVVLRDTLHMRGRLRHVAPCLAGVVVLFFLDDGTVYACHDWSAPLVRVDCGAPDSPATAATNAPAVRSVLDCGFRVPRAAGAVALSPNAAALVHLPPGADKLQLCLFESRTAAADLAPVAIAYAHAHACYTNSNSDEVVALATAQVARAGDTANRLIERAVVEAHVAISFQLNTYSKESVDKLLLNPALQKLLSLQLMLGELHSTNSTMRDVAWVVINVRATSFAIMFSLSSIYRQIARKKPIEDSLEDSTVRAESIMLLVGSTKWLIDLIVYLNQELLHIGLSKDNPSADAVSVHNSVSLPLIMSKVPRLFLMYAISSIAKAHEILKKVHKDLSESNKLFTPMKEALIRFFGVCSSLPLSLNLFEAFLRECDSSISKDLAAGAAVEQLTPLELEHQLFCIGRVPKALIPAATTMVERHYAIVSRDLKLSELFFYESDWIDTGIARLKPPMASASQDDYLPTQVRLSYGKHEAVDVLRKIVIDTPVSIRSGGVQGTGPGQSPVNRIRKCTRCRSVSLSNDPVVFEPHKTISLWTMVFHRTCICGSTWVNCI